ncbi:MAG: RsmD family RNA methyltransferase [Planctomycetia bacterium]|nr:RsmD family RNA methyltransferase [Planctomycetia bacterium]
MPRKRPRQRASKRREEPRVPATDLRIIAGRFRGRKLRYSGDVRTRPMKERVREAVFNLLADRATGKHAIDLFAGTGALGLEALSRGAVRATFIERHFPTAELIRQNAKALGCLDEVAVVPADVFAWAARSPDLGQAPWLVFCSPPYDFYIERQREMIELIGSLFGRAPSGSVFVVEVSERFAFALLPRARQWDIRAYPPAVVGILDTGMLEA